MTFSEFREQTADLEQFYEKNLNQTQVQVWYEELRDYTKERYKRAIRKVCKTSQYKPTLSVILEAIRSVDSEQTVRESEPCKACGGSGYVMYKQITQGKEYEYVSLCNCKNAKGLEYDGTKIADKEHRSPYYLPKAVDIFKARL